MQSWHAIRDKPFRMWQWSLWLSSSQRKIQLSMKWLLSLTQLSTTNLDNFSALEGVWSSVVQFRSSCFHTYLKQFFKYDLTLLLCEKHFILSAFSARFWIILKQLPQYSCSPVITSVLVSLKTLKFPVTVL